jgi:hypothetical protein
VFDRSYGRQEFCTQIANAAAERVCKGVSQVRRKKNLTVFM